MVERRRFTPGTENYLVGYKKPPLQNRFRPGQSANPAGRKRGAHNLKTDVAEALGSLVKITEDGRTRTKTAQEIVLMVLRRKALAGDARALDRMIELASRFNNDGPDMTPAQHVSVDDKAILDAYVAHMRATER
jgi:hypothetical protein